MNASAEAPSVWRSIWAVFAGFLVVVALSLGSDTVLHVAGVFPKLGERMSDGLFVLATAYRTLFGILGSYVTALLAPQKPMKHVLIGAVIGTLVATAGAVNTWNMNVGPHWYSVGLTLTAFPTAWIGAKWRLSRMEAGQCTAGLSSSADRPN